MQLRDRLCVGFAALALAHHRAVPFEREIPQRAQDEFGGAGLLARRVQILHADQPPAAARTGLEAASQRGDQRAEMQGPGR